MQDEQHVKGLRDAIAAFGKQFRTVDYIEAVARRLIGYMTEVANEDGKDCWVYDDEIFELLYAAPSAEVPAEEDPAGGSTTSMEPLDETTFLNNIASDVFDYYVRIPLVGYLFQQHYPGVTIDKLSGFPLASPSCQITVKYGPRGWQF